MSNQSMSKRRHLGQNQVKMQEHPQKKGLQTQDPMETVHRLLVDCLYMGEVWHSKKLYYYQSRMELRL